MNKRVFGPAREFAETLMPNHLFRPRTLNGRVFRQVWHDVRPEAKPNKVEHSFRGVYIVKFPSGWRRIEVGA
jgi:hypothetical protein